MKYSKLLLVFFLLLFNKHILGSVDIRLSLVSNTHNSPSPGIGTMVIDVEAISTTSTVDINSFQDAIQADGNLAARIISVGFSNQLFLSPNYNVSQNFNTPHVQFTYTFDSGNRSQILSSSWTRVVTITIQYNMINQNGSIVWSSTPPNFFVADQNDQFITGSEQTIPEALTIIPLPVELTSFMALNTQTSINLKWQTKTEVDNFGFEIERAAADPKSAIRNLPDGKAGLKFEKIGFVPGSGNSNSPKDYSFADYNPSGGSRFVYRLKQVDTDGKFQYSEEVAVDFVPKNFALFQNYPNPFNPSTTIKFAVPKAGNVTLAVYSLLGEKIKDLFSGFKEPGIYDFEFQAKDLGSGTYIYRLQADDFVQVRKMMLIK